MAGGVADAGGVAGGEVLEQYSGKLHAALEHTANLPPVGYKECSSAEAGWPVPQYPVKK